MRAARYATSRQKACQHCSAAKAKCDRKPGQCSRCAMRGLGCAYPNEVAPRSSTRGTNDNLLNRTLPAFNAPEPQGQLSSPEREPHAPAKADSPSSMAVSSMCDNSPSNSSAMLAGDRMLQSPGLAAASRPPTRDSETTLDFSCLELLCPINADDISNRWLNSYIPVPGQRIKEYPANVTAYIYRILKSYAAITVRGRGAPPFVHPSQIAAHSAARPPMATCLSLVRICEHSLPGSETVAVEVLQREMDSLHENHETYDDLALLAAFQAYLIYSLVLFFRLSQSSHLFLRQGMMNLQNIACSSSRRGLVCTAEQQRGRPKWEAWIVAEAKRRTLFTMYLFDSLLLAEDGLPTFFGSELHGLPAPADRSLWRAQGRREWETAYNNYLADWEDGGLNIDELWPMPADLDESERLGRRARVDHWLEHIDEFGTMLYAVTSCTHEG